MSALANKHLELRWITCLYPLY